MKTKMLFKPLATIIIAVIGITGGVRAQTTPANQATGTLTITLKNFGAIEVAQNATITFESYSEYLNGASTDSAEGTPAKLKVYSLSPYTVSVAVTDAGGIDESIIKALASGTGITPTAGGGVTLGTTPTAIFTGASPIWNTDDDEITVAYGITDASSLRSLTAGNHVLNLTYSIAAN